jgi:hypothetical protein
VRERRQSEKTEPRVFGTSFWCAQLSQSPEKGRSAILAAG